MSTWHWPQYVEAGLLALTVVNAVAKDGEPRGAHNGNAAFIAACIMAWLLWCGGFWG